MLVHPWTAIFYLHKPLMTEIVNSFKKGIVMTSYDSSSYKIGQSYGCIPTDVGAVQGWLMDDETLDSLTYKKEVCTQLLIQN